jgi:hypothetical protein
MSVYCIYRYILIYLWIFVRFLETSILKSPSKIDKRIIDGLVDMYVANDEPLVINEGLVFLSKNMPLLDAMYYDELDSKRKEALMFLKKVTREHIQQKAKVYDVYLCVYIYIHTIYVIFVLFRETSVN